MHQLASRPLLLAAQLLKLLLEVVGNIECDRAHNAIVVRRPRPCQQRSPSELRQPRAGNTMNTPNEWEFGQESGRSRAGSQKLRSPVFMRHPRRPRLPAPASDTRHSFKTCLHQATRSRRARRRGVTLDEPIAGGPVKKKELRPAVFRFFLRLMALLAPLYEVLRIGIAQLI